MNEIYLYTINNEYNNEIMNYVFREESVALQNMYQDALDRIKEAIDDEEKIDFHSGDHYVTVTVGNEVIYYTVERYEVK